MMARVPHRNTLVTSRIPYIEMSALSQPRPGGISARVLVTWPFRHVRWKIVLPYAVLTVALAVVGSYIAARLVTGSLSDRFDNQLAEAGRVVSDSVVRKEREHLETVRAVSFTQGVSSATLNHDTEALTRLVMPLAANAKVERLEVLDVGGNRLKAIALTDPKTLAYADITDTDQPANWPLVQKVLDGEVDQLGDKYAQIVQTSSGFVLYTIGPVKQGETTVGAVLVGTTLESFIIQAKTEALADVTLYDFEGNPLNSTYVRPEDTSSSEANLQLTASVLEPVVPGRSTVREHRTLWGRGYDLLYGRLEVRDQAVALYSVGLPTDFIFSAGNATRGRVAVLFGVGMAAVMAIGLALAHVLTRPILRLVSTARRVSSGDLTARSGVHSADEIGTLATSFDEMTERLQRQHLSTVRALTSAIDARDPYTMGHSVRVGQLAMMIGRQLGLDDLLLSRLEVGGYLHDIGKIGIRDNVLLKPGRLTEEERHAIEDHPRIGLAILEAVELPDEILDFVGGHHERLDGTGYPHGRKGTDVSVIARIAAVADIYDALTTDRPYRGPETPQKTLSILRSDAITKLDPQVIDALELVMWQWERRRAEEPELTGFRLPQLHPENVTVRS
jgi:putative nucleotidyltransferase with HDIG domain